MPGKRWIPFVAVTALVAAGAGYLYLGQPGGQARAATLSSEHAAGFQTTEKLLLTLTLNGQDSGGRALTVNEAKPREDRGGGGRGGFGGRGGSGGGGRRY